MTQIITQPNEAAIREIDVGRLLQDIVSHGVTADAAGAVKELVLLHEHRQDRDAKQQWMAAFARVRGKMRTVNATKGIPDKQGNIKWHYAPLEDLQDAVEPILELENMTLRFDSRLDGNRIIGICWIGHSAGHEDKGECAITIAGCEGGDLGALKKAKRGAMTGILGIKTRHMGDDAAMLGDYITLGQAEKIKARAQALGPEMFERFERFVKKTGAEDFSKIRQGKFSQMDDALSKAEKKANPSPAAGAPSHDAPAPSESSQANGAAAPQGTDPEGLLSSAGTGKSAAPLTTGGGATGAASSRRPKTVNCMKCGAPVANGKCPTHGTDIGKDEATISQLAETLGELRRTEGDEAVSKALKEAVNADMPDAPSRFDEPEAEKPGDPFGHWRVMSPTDTVATWDSMESEKRVLLWNKMPQDVRNIVNSNLKKVRAK